MADLTADEQVINQLRTLTLPGENEHRSRVRRYDRSYEVWRATAPRPASLEPWQSKLRVKYGMQVIDTALVNIISGEPRCIVRPRGPEDETGAKAMQAVLDYMVREDHMVEKRPVFAQQALVYGVTAAKNHWLYKERTDKGRSFYTDPYTGQQLVNYTSETIVERDGPTFEPLNVYYTFWDPNAADADSLTWVSVDYWVDKNHLLLNQHDPETGAGVYHNVRQLLEAGDRGAKQPDQTAQERFLGSGETRRKGLVHLRETWWLNNNEWWVTVVGNGNTLVRNQPSPYWHGRCPIVVANTRPDGFEIVGVPETDLVDHIQEALWTLQNMTIDNLHLTTMRGVTYREGGVTDPNSIVLKPRFKWGVVDHDDIKPFEIQPLSSDVYNERQRLLGDMQLVTGINPYVSGADLNTVDQNTATGVTALQEVASRLLRFKAAQLHYSGYQRSFEMWGGMIQQFLDREIATKIMGDTGREEWRKFTPSEVAGHFDYILEGSEESLSRQQERGEALGLLNAFAPLLAARPDINIKPILEKVASAYDFPNPEALFQAPQQAPPAAPFGGQPQQNNAQLFAQQLNGGQPTQQVANQLQLLPSN